MPYFISFNELSESYDNQFHSYFKVINEIPNGSGVLFLATDYLLENAEITYVNKDLFVNFLDYDMEQISKYQELDYEKSLEATIKNYESLSKALEETKTKFSIGSSTLYELLISYGSGMYID